MPKKKRKIEEIPGVDVRSPEGVVCKVSSQIVADSLCENHGFVDIAKETE